MAGYDPQKSRGRREIDDTEPAPVDGLLGPAPELDDDEPAGRTLAHEAARPSVRQVVPTKLIAKTSVVPPTSEPEATDADDALVADEVLIDDVAEIAVVDEVVVVVETETFVGPDGELIEETDVLVVERDEVVDLAAVLDAPFDDVPVDEVPVADAAETFVPAAPARGSSRSRAIAVALVAILAAFVVIVLRRRRRDS